MVTVARAVAAGSRAVSLTVFGAFSFAMARSCGSDGISRRITLKAHSLRLLATSLAVQVTTVVPNGKSVPLGGRHSTAALPQLSLAGGVAKATTALLTPTGRFVTSWIGHKRPGG